MAALRLLFLICSSFASLFTHIISPHYNRNSFPEGFVFGAASSAYQYEGAAFEVERTKHMGQLHPQFPGALPATGDGGRLAIIHNQTQMCGVGYGESFSAQWWGGIAAPSMWWEAKWGVNKEGIAFYNNVFNELLANGITPFVTLFHWDVPQALEDEYLGFLNPLIVDDFKDFAELCFKKFGDRIKHWITVNEPSAFAASGYDGGSIGSIAPGRCSSRDVCAQGNSATEPYIVVHHLLLAHAAAAKLYKEKYQPIQKGKVGIVVVTDWMVPYSSHELDVKAAQRALDFVYGWIMNPLVYGEYPRIMQCLVGNRLPKFTKEQATMVKGSFDYLGLNYYTGNYAAHISCRKGNISSTTDNMVRLSTDINGVPIGKPTALKYLFVYPKGLHDLLVYTKKNTTIQLFTSQKPVN
ncbi:Beta-glucosidase 12 [Sesamum angolense]|uniref:Beta-glucosidase 12 n=1 Tax=Sesamum angolense TaxID=2727404 RepID=A0AAE1WPJ6_9LAMI|nr:Beta-glucosidase 12 [Sesamum angolense]